MPIQTIAQIIYLDPTSIQPSGWNQPKINGTLPLDVIVAVGTGNATKYWFTSRNEIIRNQTSLSFDDQKNVIAIGASQTVNELNKIRDKPGRISVIENESSFRVLLSAGTAEPTAGLNLTELTFSKNGNTQSSPSAKTIFSAGIASVDLETFTGIEIALPGTADPASPSTLKVYEVRTQDLSNESSDQTVKVGYLAVKADAPGSELPPAPPASLDEGYFLDLSINPAMLADSSLLAKESGNSLLLAWSKFSTNSTSTYLEVTKAQLAASPVNSLSLQNLLAMEKKYQVDLNNDGLNNGSIDLIAPDISSPQKTSLSIQLQGTGTATQTIEVFKLSNGDFVTAKKQSDFLKSSDNSLTASFTLDKINSTFNILTSSFVLDYETRQLNKNKIDINDDGIIGAAVLKTLVATDNFGIYQTTLGDIVYAEAPDLNNGDAITSPVAIPFKTDDLIHAAVRKQLLAAEGTVARIAQIDKSKFLQIGALSSDPIGGEFSLKEVSFEIKVANNTPSLSLPKSPLPTITLFNEIASQRQAFLQKEVDYSSDLNKDGVIGDGITEELATSASGSVYRLASGTVFFSTNTLLNVGDRAPTSDTKLFDYGYAPEKIFACNLVGTNLQLIYLSGSKFFSETFTKAPAATSYSPAPGSKVELSNLDLTQAEINYTVDINDDGIIGDTISAVAFGYNSDIPASQPGQKSQDIGLYALTNKTPFLRDAYIVTNNPSLKAGDTQPSLGALVLKNNGASADAYWSIPNNTAGAKATVIAAGMFDDAKSAVRLVLEMSASANKSYSLVTFDKNGVTNTPRGNTLTKFTLFNEEIKLQTDIDGDGHLGDTASRIASKDGFGVYHLNGSGSIVVRNDDGWDTESGVIRQASIDFVELKNSLKGNWLPFGYTQSVTSQGYELKNSDGSAKINQVAFNPDGTINIYVSRNIVDKNGAKNTLYNVEFNNKGITKNPAGTALTQTEIFNQELSKEIDINGDGYVGKPYLTLQISSSVQDAIVLANDAVFYKNNPTDQFTSLLIPTTRGPMLKANLSGSASKTFLPDWSRQGSTILESDMFYSSITKKSYFISSDNTSISATDSSGKLTFKADLPYAIPRGVGDFNGDGQQDLAFWSTDGISFSFFKGNGKGGFTPLQKFTSPISLLNGTASNVHMLSSVANMNGDKYSDFIILQKNTASQNGFSTNGKDQIVVYTNKKGVLSASEKFSFEVTNEISSFVTTDINGDNRDDLILVKTKTDTIEIALNTNGKFTSNGEFINNFSLSGIYKPRQVAVADINGDGIKDIVALAETEDESTQGQFIQGIFAYFGKGGGEFLQPQMLANEKDMSLGGSLALGRFLLEDLNSDGLSEVILTTDETSPKIFTLWNLSNVAYGSKKFNAPISTSLVTEMNYADFEDRMQTLGFDPKFYTSSSIVSGSITTRPGDGYAMSLSSTTNGGQIQISTGNSNSPDINFSVFDTTSIRASFSSNTPISLASESYPNENRSLDASYGGFVFRVDNSKAGWDNLRNVSDNDRVIFSKAASAGLIQFGTNLALITTTDAGVSHGVVLNGLTKNSVSIGNFSSGNFDSVEELNNLYSEKIIQIAPSPSKSNIISLEIPGTFLVGSSTVVLGEGDFRISFPPSNSAQITLGNFNAGDQLILPDNLSGSFADYDGILQFSGNTNNSTPFIINFQDVTSSSAAQLIGGSNIYDFNELQYGYGQLV